MDALRPFAARILTGLLVLVAAAASAAPANYVLTGKFTSNRGALINIPLEGNTPCAGAGLSNLRIMSGPGLTGHSILSMTMTMVPNPTPAVHPISRGANERSGVDHGCVGFAPDKKVTTTGIGVGGQLTLPTHVLIHPAQGAAIAFPLPNRPLIQLFTSFAITGPNPVGMLLMSTNPLKSPGPNWKANWRKLQKNAHLQQTGRVQGAMFTYCWGNPGCTNVAQGTRRLIVKYTGGGNNFGGTMSYVLSSGPQPSSFAVGAGGGPVGFAILGGPAASQVTGRAYAARNTVLPASGPLWGMYMLGPSGLITTVDNYLGPNFPPATYLHRGFPFTTMTVIGRTTGSQVATTITAKGGDTVTSMGKRNISLVAGGMAHAVLGSTTSNTPTIAQLYLPEPSRAAQLLASTLALLAVGIWRRRRDR